MGSSINLLFSTLLLFFITIDIIIISSPNNFSSAQQPFRCSPRATCNALIDYVSTNATTLAAVGTLFTVNNYRSILGANNLPLSTPPNFPIAAQQPIRIPFPCACTNNGTGISDRMPEYRVAPEDGLYHIAAEVFSGLVTYQEIAAVNNISDANLIVVGQNLWIPLPCSCDEVEGKKVVHYGHVVAQGSTVEGIAAQYNTSQDTLLRLNNLNNSRDLIAGAVLDVPLTTCSSMVNNNTGSLDYPLLVPNGTYQLTANNCVICKCDIAAAAALNRSMLGCEPSGINSSNCPPMRCGGAESGSLIILLGNTTSSTLMSGCNRTTNCAYAGYTNNHTILTTLALESNYCPASDNRSSSSGGMSMRLRRGGWRWNHQLLIYVQIWMMMMLLFFSSD